MTNPRLPIRAPRGTELTARSWQTEAALRMLMNNLDPEVAERPEDLVVYGGTGKAARTWEAYDAIVATLATLADDETLLVQSGKPVGVMRTNPWAPRVLLANSNLVGDWANWEEFRRLEQLGLIMYGQMTAGSWIYIGTQGILQGTFETFAAVADKRFGGTLAGTITLTAGLGGMGGAQPLAVTMNDGVAICIECDPARIDRRIEHRYLDVRADSAPHALELATAARQERRALSIGVLGNAAELVPALLAGGGGSSYRVVHILGLLVEVAELDAAGDTRLVALDADDYAAVHRHGQRLGAAHATQAAGQRDRAFERTAEALGRDRRERLVGALQDALGADVDPGTGGHLAVHGQAELLQAAELLPGGPLRDQVGVGDEHARGPLVCSQDPDGLAGLDQERLVVLEVLQGPDDRRVGVPAAGGATGAAVDDELVGVFGHLGVEVVHEHAHGRFLRPPFAGSLGAARRVNRFVAGDHVPIMAGRLPRRQPGGRGQAATSSVGSTMTSTRAPLRITVIASGWPIASENICRCRS